MREVLITSSVLIAALLLLRRIFRNTLSRRVQYALWGLVLVRLLVPVSLPAVDFSVLTAAQPIQETVAARAASRTAAITPVLPAVADAPAQDFTASAGEQTQSAADVSALPEQSGAAAAPASSAPALSQVLATVWKAGIALAGLFFLLSNLRFWRRLRRCRRPYPVEGVSRRVYLVEGGVLPSPCLFGLFRPAVYLTPAAVSSEESLRHVLVHEETHARHLDPLWALLRCVCLAVYWFDPLVWIAAACSKADCELACDEGALARLGEEQRIPYGQTLLSLIPVRKGPANPFAAATTMAVRKKQIKNRIARIAQKPRQFAAAAVAVAVLAGAVSACTFTGAKPAEIPDASGSEAAREATYDYCAGKFLAVSSDHIYLITREHSVLAISADGQVDILPELQNIKELYPGMDGILNALTLDGSFVTTAALTPADYQALLDDPSQIRNNSTGRAAFRAAQFSGLSDLKTGLSHYPYYAVAVTNAGTAVAIATDSGETAQWENLRSITGDPDAAVLGLYEDGTVVCAGNDEAVETSGYQSWENVAAVYHGNGVFFGLREDGRIYADTYDRILSVGAAQMWAQITMLAVSRMHVAGLRADGTVAACGDNRYGQCGTGDWTDIIAVAACDTCTVGIDKQGVLHIAGQNPFSDVNFTDLADKLREEFIGFSLYSAVTSG